MKPLLVTSAITLLASFALAFEPPANSEVVLDDAFERTELGEGWSVQNGSWTIESGILHSAELAADQHPASARRTVETGNAVYQLKFRLGDGAKGFHLGFDPKRGSLDKKGHLFSVIITPRSWKLIKHLDKNQPEKDPNEILASADHEFEPGTWYTLRIVTWGPTVKAMIEGIGIEPLTASHPTFTVAKPALVFRTLGDGVDLDEVKVWVPAK